MRAILTPDDLKSGTLVDPGWKPVEYTDYEEKESKGEDKSTNCIFEFTVLDGPYKGVKVNKLINEKPQSLGHVSNHGLWKAFGITPNKDGNFEFSTELFKAKLGAKLMVYIKRGKSDRGNEFNDVSDYKPMGPA